ncbi:MAG: bifunctional folylpolyglutamate synthase/dihydrofolate synthase [Lachnospiraceae bacterium]
MEQENFLEVVERIYNIPLFTKKNDMLDTKSFLARMGHLDGDMKIIHVAGTNGKGSTCAYLSALLQKAGYKVGMFSSPHLVDIRERFLLNGEMISEKEFLSGVQEIDRLLLETTYKPSFFEYLFFVGMYIFRKNKVEFLVLETGLGGRLDATNSIHYKVLSIITKIAMDHTQYLGDTIEKIATEKAGIIKENTPVVFLEQDGIVNTVIDDVAWNLHAPVEKVRILEENEIVARDKCIAFFDRYQYDKREEFVLSTQAMYQTDNARLALRAMEVLVNRGIVEQQLPTEEAKKALYETSWAGRMEEILPGIYLDGAHNLNGIYAFVRSVKNIACLGNRILIFAAVEDKDYSNMLEKILSDGLFTMIILTQVDNKRRVCVDKFNTILLKQNSTVHMEVTQTFQDAIQTAMLEKNPKDHIFIAGSLYLVGEAKSYFM